MKYTSLSNFHIAEAVEALRVYLETTTLPREDCIRTTFAIEEALLQYQAQCGEGTSFTLTCGKKWGRSQFTLTVSGAAFNPFDISDDEEDTAQSVMHTIMGRMGLFPSWRYAAGGNVISMVMPKIASAPMKKLGLAIVAAFLVYAITLLCPESLRLSLYTYGVAPLTDVFIGMVSALSGPIIFCSIACSISGMGDISTFGKIGKQAILSLLRAIFVVTILGCGWLVFLYPPVTMSTEGGSALFELYELLLSVIPSNLFEPFVNSDPMQILTLAVVVGVALLVLQKKTPELTCLVEQCSSVLQYMMELVSAQLHIYVFLSVLGMLLANQSAVLIDAYVLFLLFVPAHVLVLGYSCLKARLKTGVSIPVLIKKLAPSFLIALATSSSAAALSCVLKTCKEKLGISKKLVEFAIPFGQVTYMPGCAFMFGILGFYMYDAYDLTISVSMILMLFLLSIILSIALPPIPAGTLIVINILYAQLGIPDAALSLSIIVLTILAFTNTAVNLFSLQVEILCIAKDLDLLDGDVLKSECV